MNSYMEITYYHTLYKKEVKARVWGEVKFEDGRVIFASCGHKRGIEFEYIKKIELIEE